MELTKKLFRNLKAILASLLGGAAKHSYDPVRELNLIKVEATDKLRRLEKECVDVITSRESAKDMQRVQDQKAEEFKAQARQAKAAGDEARAKRLLEIHLKHKENTAVFKKSIDNMERLRLEIVETHSNLELEVMSIDAQISSVSVMSDLAKLDIESNDPRAKINVTSIREAIDRADTSVRNLEHKATAQRETNQIFSNEDTSTTNYSSEVDELFAQLD